MGEKSCLGRSSIPHRPGVALVTGGRELVSDAGRAHGILLPRNPLPGLSG